jgi:alpha-L-arabinofuranosidase
LRPRPTPSRRARGIRKRIGLSVDEYNVWYQTANPHFQRERAEFEHAPGIAQDTYDVADALVVGCLLITLLRHADRVRMACLAQLVNVIPAISTLDGGPAWRQTIFFPFLHAARHARGTVLRAEPDAPTYDVPDEGAVPVLEATAVHDAESGRLTILAVNRAAQALALEVVLRDLDGVQVTEHLVLCDEDLRACNTADRPDRVVPRPGSGARLDGALLRVELPPRSWNVLVLGSA